MLIRLIVTSMIGQGHWNSEPFRPDLRQWYRNIRKAMEMTHRSPAITSYLMGRWGQHLRKEWVVLVTHMLKLFRSAQDKDFYEV